MKIFKSILLSFLAIILFLVSVATGYAGYKFSSMTTSISKNYDDLGIDSDTLAELEELKLKNNFNSDEIVNIALFGIDSRSTTSSSNSRSDSIMIVSIDKKHNKIKISSIMRDTYSYISGRGYDKINHAYAFGGPELAIKTINQNFGLDIQDYVTVDFFGLEEIIDAIGGVEVEVKSNEINELNKYIKEVANIENKTPTLITQSGLQKLNGMQAVSYGRIRKVGNGDYERTDRQRAIIISMINSLQKLGLNKTLKLASQCVSYVNTSFTMAEAVKIGTDILQDMSSFTIEQQRFPVNGEGKTINGVWYMVSDLDDEKSLLHQFIYENN